MIRKTLAPKVAAKPPIQPVKWHGGKRYLAKWIISLMPPHLHYVEPFVGGGTVLLYRNPDHSWFSDGERELKTHERGASELANDIHGDLVNLYRVLAGDEEQFDRFKRIVDATPFSRDEFLRASQFNGGDPAERAAAFFIHARQSRQGLMRDFATPTRKRTRGRRNGDTNAYWNCVDDLPQLRRRLRYVVFENMDACKLIRREDTEVTCFYCDPPYVHETRQTTSDYTHEMTVEQHEELLAALAGIQGKFLLSGYRCRLYDDFAARHGWNRHDMQIDNKASSKKEKESETECIWTNF